MGVCCVVALLERTAIHCLNKTSYMGHRALLEMNNVLRWYVVSGKCCPPGYYTGNKESETEVKRLVGNMRQQESARTKNPKSTSCKRIYKPHHFRVCFSEDIDSEMSRQDKLILFGIINQTFPLISLISTKF